MPGSKPEDILTARIPINGESLSRGSTSAKDQFFANGYFDVLKNSILNKEYYYFVKRPGLTLAIQPSGTSGVARGAYSWRGSIYSVYGSKIYKNTTDLGVTLSTSTGRVGIEATRATALTPFLCVNDGTALYVIDTSDGVTVLNNVVITSSSVANPSVITTATAHGLATGNKVILRGHTGSTPTINDTVYTVTVTSPTTFTIPVNVTTGGTGGTIGVFPTPNKGQLVYFDGYLVTLKNDGSIVNCDLDDPRLWDPTKFIVPIMDNSGPIGITRQANFIICCFETHTQAFYNAANATGSPFTNYDPGMLQFGCAAKDSLANEESFVTWVGQSGTGGLDVLKLEGLSKTTNIGDPTIRRALEAEGTSISTATGHLTRVAGHLFYILYLQAANRTFVYDYDLMVWYEWFSTSGAGFPIYDYFQHNNRPAAQHQSNGKIYYLDPTVGQDDSVNFTHKATFNRTDFDTNDRKFVHAVELIGDIQASTTPLLLSYSDDDYQTWSTDRTIDMSYGRALAKGMGNFRRRAHRYSYTGPNPMRISALQITYRLGGK